MASNVYTLEYQRKRAHYGASAVACFRELVNLLGRPATMIDIGCGSGVVVDEARLLGIRSVGVDQAQYAPLGSGIIAHDLATPFSYIPAELALCWEVAEHLPESAADTLCQTLALVTGIHGRLVFTAATPGQGGPGHINEQPHEYWVEKLHFHGLKHQRVLSDRLRSRWLAVAPKTPWYGKNVMVFE